jgi:hypothetical protein
MALPAVVGLVMVPWKTLMARLRLPLTILTAAASGCAGISAESPLTVALGQPRVAAEASLRVHQYCHAERPPERLEVYPRCDRPGVEFGDSWVVATYDGDRLVELRRNERFEDDAHAVARWNQLVIDRSDMTKPTVEAGNALHARSGLLPGTRSVAAFRVDAVTVVGVYLMTPGTPDDPAVIERVVELPPAVGGTAPAPSAAPAALPLSAR